MQKIKWIFTVALGLFFVCQRSTAQDNGFREIDDRPWHYGFVLGLNANTFHVTPALLNTHLNQGAQVSSISPGFTVGLILDLRLSKFLNLRTTPTLNLYDCVLSYQDSSLRSSSTPQTPATLTFKTSAIDIPILLKYRSIWYGHSRPYLLFGGGITYNLSNKGNDSNGITQVTLNATNFYATMGVGCDFYFKYFRLAPELRFSLGLNNLLNPTPPEGANPSFTNELLKITSRALVLNFNFE
ncbi:MAG: porin family protein [Microbacter sp.]